uniref:Uncharacterized protein n=1 Tax=Lygus hesperus TaxID=30085 RepID=A0A146KLU9_LYGHE
MTTNVDIEPLSWIDVCVNKYRNEHAKFSESFANQHKDKGTLVDFACSDDLQYIVLVGVYKIHDNFASSMNVDETNNTVSIKSTRIGKKKASSVSSTQKTNTAQGVSRKDFVV